MRHFLISLFTFLAIISNVSANSVLITGANQGIGMGFVKYYLDKGYKVYATYRSKETSQDLLKMNKENLVFVQTDFEKPDEALQHIKETLQNQPLDILILNAGYFADKANHFGELEGEDFQRAFTVNALAPLLLSQGLKDNLMAGQEKKIVAISSRRASIQQTSDEKYIGRYGYRCSKAALNAGMSALALDMPQMTILILHPGRVQTHLTNFDPNALTVEQSVHSMAELISKSSPFLSGKFYDYKGEMLPW